VSEITGNRVGCCAEAVQHANESEMANANLKGVEDDLFMRLWGPIIRKEKGYK